MNASIRRRAIALCFAALGLAPALARAECEGTPGAARLIVDVDGVRSDKGLMTASLYPGDKSQFLIKNGALKVWRVSAQAPVTQMCIWLKGPGTYAVAVYHDANANDRFDIGLLGPTEGGGFSNNPRVVFFRPSFDAAKFHAGEGDPTIQIHLRYPGR